MIITKKEKFFKKQQTLADKNRKTKNYNKQTKTKQTSKIII